MNVGKAAEQSGLVKKLSWAVGDGIPYGDYVAETAKAKLANNYSDVKYVFPENKPHLLHYLVQIEAENMGAYARKYGHAIFGSVSKEVPLRHLSMPNIFADTQYIRPLIKEVDARMKASGFSEAVFEMQTKMRNLTEEMRASTTMTGLQYRKGMQDIYMSYATSATFQKASKQFVDGLDKIIFELQNKLDSATKPAVDIDGNPIKESQKAFKNEASASGKSGVTTDQVRNMLDYYKDIRLTALNAANKNSGFADKYLKFIPEDITTIRNKVADSMNTTFIGYQKEDGVVGGSRLGRIGSEVEQRATGYNLFMLDPNELSEINKWSGLSEQQKLAKADDAFSKNLFNKIENDEWNTLTSAEKIKKMEDLLQRPAEARYDELTRLERSFKNSIASTHDRKAFLKTKGDSNNPEAIFWTLFHEHEKTAEWSVPGGNDFGLRLVDIEKQGYEENIAELVDMLINMVGTETGKKKTMPIGQIDAFINTALRDTSALDQSIFRSAGDEYKTEILGKVKERLGLLKQSPVQDGPRDVAAESWMPYYSEYYVARAFASTGHQEIPIPAKNLVTKVASVFSDELAESIKKGTKINMPASAPQGYLTLQWAQNNTLWRPLSYLLGIDTKTATITVHDITDARHYAPDTPKWSKLNPLNFSGEKYTPIEGDDAWTKTKNVFGWAKNTYHNSPAIVKMPVRVMTAGLDLIGRDGVKNGGILAYLSRAFYATALVGGLAYTADGALKDEDWGTRARDSINYTLTPSRNLAEYGIGYGYAGLVYGLERIAQGITFAATGTASNITGNKNAWTVDDAYLGIGEEIYKNRKNLDALAAKYIRIPNLGGSDEEEASPPEENSTTEEPESVDNEDTEAPSPWAVSSSDDSPTVASTTSLRLNYNDQSAAYTEGASQFNIAANNLSIKATANPLATEPQTPKPTAKGYNPYA